MTGAMFRKDLWKSMQKHGKLKQFAYFKGEDLHQEGRLNIWKPCFVKINGNLCENT